MDKYDYVINKPEMEEVLYHAGFHKYIDKYLGKNGKWIYKYAGQAKSAATGAINKAKTMLPGLQKQATGAVSTVKKKTSSALSTGSKTASGVKKQAQKKISSMLPILSKKLNSAKKSASSSASKLKKQADGTMKNVSKTAKKIKDKNLYQRTKHNIGQSRGKYKSRLENYASSMKGSSMKGDSRYKAPDPTKKSVAKYHSKNTGPFPSDWQDLRFKGYSNSMTNAGEKGIKTKEGIAAGRKRTGKIVITRKKKRR